MRPEWSAEQRKLQQEIRDFADKEIAPYAAVHDMEQMLHEHVIAAMAEAGHIGSMLPKTYGGSGMDNISLGILNEEIGRACSSIRSLLTVHGMVSLAIMRWGTDEQKQSWLPRLASGETISSFALSEPVAGSDASGIETTATRDGDGYVLNGCKKWITCAQISDLYLVFALCEGQPSAFLVERNRPGITVVPMGGLLGARASMIAEIRFKDCRIPQENLLGRVGIGLSHIALPCLDYGRYTIACGAVGLGQACLEASVEYAGSRKQFGRPLSDNQLIRKMITEMSVQVKAARMLCLKAGYLRDSGDPDSIIETWTAKYFASVMAMKAASDAVQIHGANGCHEDYPVERYYRDAKINEIIEGTTQMHEIQIAAHELAVAPPPPRHIRNPIFGEELGAHGA